jgi:hypothetical protein
MRAALIAVVAGVMALAPAAVAAEVEACGDWRTSVQAVAEPWDKNTQTYAYGRVRAVVMDTVEPAAGSVFLVLLHPPVDETGAPLCSLISSGAGGDGFGGLDLAGAVADFDAPDALFLDIPASLYSDATARFDAVTLQVMLDLATGVVTAGIE